MTENNAAEKSTKMIAISVSVLAVIISGIQVYAAVQNNRLVEAQTVEGFIPHLMNSKTKDVALVAMNNYVDRKVVNSMASLLKSQSALQVLATSGSKSEKESSSTVLAGLNNERAALLNNMFADEKSTRVSATTSLIENWAHDAELLQQTLDRASKSLDNKSGVINSLVLLQYFDDSLLASYKNELNDFFKRVEKNGPQTRSHIEKIQAKIEDANKQIQPDSLVGG